MNDAVIHPKHYCWHPVCECIKITQEFNLLKGTAIKYIWRAEHKGSQVEDLRKAINCLEMEIERITNGQGPGSKAWEASIKIALTDIQARAKENKDLVPNPPNYIPWVGEQGKYIPMKVGATTALNTQAQTKLETQGSCK